MLDRRTVRDRRGHHPWLYMGRVFPDWRIVFTDDLPEGHLGHTVHAVKEVRLATQMSIADRRSTLTHETGHVIRGAVAEVLKLREELICDRLAARLLMPSVKRIGHALSWHHANHELAAEDLWVDEQLLNARLSSLNARERAWLLEQLDTILI